jgi:hypothetical protein
MRSRDQSMEMNKDFERTCLRVRITLNQLLSDYTVALNHIEHGFALDNRMQVANRDGDHISTTGEGGSINGGVKKAWRGDLILGDWAAVGVSIMTVDEKVPTLWHTGASTFLEHGAGEVEW